MRPNTRSSCETMGQGSTWATHHAYLVCSSGCTRRRNFPALGLGWQPFSASSIATEAGPGRPARRMKGPRFISRSRSTRMDKLLEPPAVRKSGEDQPRKAELAMAEEKPGLQVEGRRGHNMLVKGPLQVLIVEDSENDATLLELELQ